MEAIWWVNQGRSYERERELGVAWAPLLTDKGRRQHHWDRMDEVGAGDRIVHYAQGQVRAVSRVLLRARPAANPHATTDWTQQGRELTLDYQELDVALKLTDIPDQIRRDSAGYGSAFDQFGAVNLGYFFYLPDPASSWMLSEVGLRPPNTDSAPTDSGGDQGAPQLGDLIVGPDGRTTVTTRAEHGQLKSHLFKGRREATCALCGRVLPVNLLVTAHIKPRAQCSKDERVDRSVVMAACALGCDALFERGFVIVSPEGLLKIADGADQSAALRDHLISLEGRAVETYSRHNSKYFAWHEARHSK